MRLGVLLYILFTAFSYIYHRYFWGLLIRIVFEPLIHTQPLMHSCTLSSRSYISRTTVVQLSFCQFKYCLIRRGKYFPTNRSDWLCLKAWKSFWRPYICVHAPLATGSYQFAHVPCFYLTPETGLPKAAVLTCLSRGAH